MVAFGSFISHIDGMANARTSERRKRTPSSATGTIDRGCAARVASALRSLRGSKTGEPVQLLVASGQRVALPAPLADVVARAATLLAEGRNVSVVADDDMLTTQGAAERLNVSRQYVVRLADRGELPAVKVGSHRRLRASDVEAYRAKRGTERDAALDRLAEMSEEMGGYRRNRGAIGEVIPHFSGTQRADL